MSLKIGVIFTPPLTSNCSFDPICPYRGYGVDSANIVCEYLKLNCTFIWYDNRKGEYGDADKNGTGTGLVGAIQREEFDLSLPVVVPTYSRSRAVQFSNRFFVKDVAIATRAPNRESDEFDWSLFSVFDWPIYCFLFFELFLISLLITLSLPAGKRNKNFFRFFRIGAALVTERYKPSLLVFDSTRIVIGVWALASLVLGSAYTGIMFSQKVLKNTNLPFEDLKSFAECLEIKRCRLIMPYKTNSFYMELIAPGSPMADRISEAVKFNPIIIMPQEKILEAVLKEKRFYFVWVWSKPMLYGIMGNRNCMFYMIDTPHKHVGTFAIRKNAPLSLVEKLDEVALIFRESGIEYKLWRKYERPLVCNDERGIAGSGLNSVRTIFYFYALGVSSGGIVFLGELAKVYLQMKSSL